MKLVRFAATFAVLAALAGCADYNKQADALAQPAGLKRVLVKTNPFVLTAYTRLSSTSGPIDVYIEGDGLAWLSQNRPSRNPTPRQALGLSLAAKDKSANVIYLARPCQFTPPEMNPRCDIPFWTGKRFSEEVIASMDQALDKLIGSDADHTLNLIGYSGGGAVAVLLAARRYDVASIRTLAGNLDHDAVNKMHDVSLMPESLNAIDVTAKVAAIPQIHFSGSEDEVVPPVIAERFRVASASACVQTKVIPGVSHEEGWRETWPALLAIALRCANEKAKP
jgi:pimeloyl-ACP methyl ester carboxylesterase